MTLWHSFSHRKLMFRCFLFSYYQKHIYLRWCRTDQENAQGAHRLDTLRAIQLFFFFFLLWLLVIISRNNCEILSWAQGLTLPLNTELYQLLAVIAWLSSVFLGNTNFLWLSHTHSPNWHLNAVHLNTALHAHYFSPQFTGVSTKCENTRKCYHFSSSSLEPQRDSCGN